MSMLTTISTNLTKYLFSIFLAICFLSLQACGMTSYVTENYIPMVKQVPYKIPKPIAREIKFVYADGNMISGVGGSTNFLVATNLSNIEQVNQRGISFLKSKYPHIKNKHFQSTSTLQRVITLNEPNIAAKGRAAEKKLASRKELSADELGAYQTLGMAESFDTSISLMNASIATISALQGWVRATHEENGYLLKGWVEKHTGAIGPSAPKGSVLNIDFIRALKGRSFKLSSHTDFVVSAYLERKGKKTIYASRGFQMKILDDDAKPELTQNMVKYIDAAAYIRDKPEIQNMKNVIYGVDLSALATAVIRDIHQQLEK